MPYCPKCGAEYRQGVTECSDCFVALVDGPYPEDKEYPWTGDDEFDETLVPTLVAIYSEGRIQADVIRSALEGSGIPAVMAREGYTSAYPLTVGAIGEGRVLVREEDRGRALEVIAAATQGSLDLEAPDETPLGRSRLFWIFATAFCIAYVVLTILGVIPGP